MTVRDISFSRQIKDELSQIPCHAACCRQIELATAFWAAGRFTESHVDLATSHAGCARRLVQLADEQYGVRPQMRSGRELLTIRLDRADAGVMIQSDIRECFLAEYRQDPDTWSMCCRQAFLRSLFLVSGSVSDPRTAYHMELALRKENNSAAVIKETLDQAGFHSSLASRERYTFIYLREGQQLADYLLMAGAHQSLLAFESLRVEKEMRNSVNRIVNCDNANMQRVADTAARQLELIGLLQERGLLDRLPPDLKAAAVIRLEQPDLTLRELGALLQPPLGKSGINHRLKRLEQLASEWLAREDN